MAAHQTLKRYNSNRGLDLKSTDLNRDPRFATAMKNAQYTEAGAINKRRGYQWHSAPDGGFGLYKYNRVNSSNVLEEIELSVGRGLSKLNFTTLTVSYGGAEASAYISLFYDPTTAVYRCQLTAGVTQVLDFSLGEGIDETTPVTITQLETAINAVADFTASVSGDGSVAAAALKIVRDFDVKAEDWDGVAGYWSAVNSPITNPFDGSYTRRNNTDFENVSAVNVGNIIYFSNGYDEVYKYDGQTLYRAGLPLAASLTSAIGAAGAVTGSNYYHRAQYVQVDAVGNIVAGNIKTVSTGLAPAAQKMTVTVANIQSSTGFNTNAAMVAGAQVAVNTINVDNGAGGAHTLNVNDTAYFFDSISGGYVERNITARTNSTITIAGAAVTVADNDPISNNLRIQIQRNKTSATTPTVFYEVVEIPNNPFVATQTYTDNTTDANLGATVVPPGSDRSPPPKGKYLCTFQNMLFIAGRPDEPRKFNWSDIEGPEYFPSDTNQENIENPKGEIITGIGAQDSFMAVFTDTFTYLGSGAFAENNYRVESKAENIGCSSHSSIIAYDGYLAWWSSRGPYRTSGGQIPTAIGPSADGDSRIAPVMSQKGYEFNPSFQPLFFRAKRCVGINWLSENKLLFFLPCESLSGTDRYANENSRVFAYDYTRDAWLEWDNLDFSGGAVLYSDEFHFKSRRLDDVTVKSDLFRMHNLNDAFDYQDNLDPVNFDYAPQWEFLGEPGVLKKFLELQVYPLEDLQNNVFSVTVQQEMNFQDGSVDAEFDLELTGAGYGQSEYGSERYGDSSSPKLVHELSRTRCFSTRTRFTNANDQQNCIISGWEFLYTTPYRTELKT